MRARLARLEHKVPIPEHKWFDSTTSNFSIPATGSVVALDGIVQGDGQNERIGDSVKATSTFYRYTITRVLVDSYVRIIHFIWKSNDVPTVASILQTATVVSPLNRDNGRIIRVLTDKLYTLATGQTQQQVEKHSKRLWYTNKYDSDAVTTTSVNGLYVLFISDQGTGANQPVINYYNRLTYTDM